MSTSHCREGSQHSSGNPDTWRPELNVQGMSMAAAQCSPSLCITIHKLTRTKSRLQQCCIHTVLSSKTMPPIRATFRRRRASVGDHLQASETNWPDSRASEILRIDSILRIRCHHIRQFRYGYALRHASGLCWMLHWPVKGLPRIELLGLRCATFRGERPSARETPCWGRIRSPGKFSRKIRFEG